MYQLFATQVDEEGVSREERTIFRDRIKVKHGVIIARNPSSAESPDYLVSRFDWEEERSINLDALATILKDSISMEEGLYVSSKVIPARGQWREKNQWIPHK